VAWNQPGSGGKDPWGQKKNKNDGPPDLDEIVRNLQKKIGSLFGGNGSNKGNGGGPLSGKAQGMGAAMIVIIAFGLWCLSGFYIVEQGEQGVVQQFGKLSEQTEAGLRWHLPWPIETVTNVNIQKITPVEIGYRSNARTGSKTKVPREALMLTEDENIIDIEFAVQYRIKNAADYLFNTRNVETTIVQATEAAVREVAGKSTMDFVLTAGRDEVGQKTHVLLQKTLDLYKTGILITKVEMQEAQPPEEVRAAFDDAVKAREDEVRFKNEAEAYSNDLIPRARGTAARMLEEAQGYKASVIARAEGDAKRFTQILREYSKAPRVTRDRLYIETLEYVMANSTKILVDQKGGNNLMYLPLDKLVSQGSGLSNQEMIDNLKKAKSLSESATSGVRSRSRSDLRSRRVGQ